MNEIVVTKTDIEASVAVALHFKDKGILRAEEIAPIISRYMLPEQEEARQAQEGLESVKARGEQLEQALRDIAAGVHKTIAACDEWP